MIRTIIANTPLNDVNQGSVLLTILEAAAANDFENNAAILSLLNLLNIATVSGTDLDNRAADYGLTRYAAVQASGNISIFNTSITLQSTSLYILKPPPIASQTVLYVNNTTGWAASGTLYIGRGTISFEGPIPYSSITVYPTYSQINLSSALQNNHLISDTVINAQGQPDRIIAAGTVVSIPANSQNPQVNYTTLRDAILPAGNTEVDNVPVIAQVAGSIGNAPINTIVQFQTSPFPGATVTNTSALSGGADVETDQDLRNRINEYPNTLARGTEAAILAAVINISDATDNKQVASAIIQEPPVVDEPSILYIDDGTGFQPSFAGQSVDNLLINASGNEEFLQTANYPIARPQVINTGTGPFALADGSSLTVIVDGISETIYFYEADFVNISTAQVAEVVVAINNQSKNFSARLTNNSANILLYPDAFNAEIIQVLPLQSSDAPALYANTQFQFPTAQFSFIALYQNSTRLREKTITAQLETTGFASWNISAPGDLAISVDGTPSQDRFFSLANFPGVSSFALLTLADWVAAFNQQFAGITATATSTQTMILSSNNGGATSSLAITGGSFLDNLFPTQPTAATGQVGQFILNRQTGNLQILTTINPGDDITAGSPDTRGFVTSAKTSSGTYNLSTDTSGRPAEMIIVADSTYCNQVSVTGSVGSTLTISNPTGDVMRIMSNMLGTFQNVQPGDFFFTPIRTSAWLSTSNTGLFKVIARGAQETAGVDTYIDVLNPSANIVAETVSIADAADLQAFSTDGYPQLWLPGRAGTSIANISSAALNDIIYSINNDLINVLASVYQSSAVKITSTTELNGSIAIPVIIGSALALFTSTPTAKLGNSPLVASIVSSKSLLTYFKIDPPSNANTFLSRQTFVDSKGALSADTIPSPPPYSAPYGEVLVSPEFNTTHVDYDSVISLTRGNNRDQLRTIAAFPASNEVGTQEALPRSSLDYTSGDEFEIVRGLQLSAFDTLVAVIDQNPQNNTINVSMARTGQVNSGNGTEAGYVGGDASVGAFTPTSTEFSATDYQNQPGIDFGNINVWGTSQNNTNFNDYAVWFRARNWYATGGAGSGGGALILRAAEYGPNGNFLRFNMAYPTIPLQTALTDYVNTPSYTTFTYYFGSGPARTIALSGGYTMSVKGPYPDTATNFPNGAASTGNYYDYTFSAGNFTSVQVGDIISVTNASGIPAANQGQFGVQNISGNTVRVLNPSASATAPGAPVVDTITTTADVVGTPTIYDVTAVADVGGSLNGKYFVVNDTAGSVAVWINEGGTAAQPSAGTSRYIMVGTVLSGDSASTVATKIANVINQDRALTAGVSGPAITITNVENGTLAAGSAGTSGFTVSTASAGTPDDSLSGKYFIIYDNGGPVSVWFDVGNQGTAQPYDGSYRNIRVYNLSAGASANTVALAVIQAMTGDASFGTPTAVGNVVTVTNTFDGQVPAGNAGTSGFTVSSTTGSFTAPNVISNPIGINIFPLTGTSTASIAATINAGSMLNATPVGSSSLNITRSTVEEIYSYSGNATALAYGHNPNNPALNSFVSLYDAVNWIKTFENANPNFTLKVPFLLQGVSSVYAMDTAPNSGGVSNGELFQLIPITVENLYNQLTQAPISQLPIVATVEISDDRKNLQIQSKSLGSAGAVQIVGGTGNQSEAYLQSEAEIATDSSGSYLVVQVPAYPDTISPGDTVMLTNPVGVQRFNRILGTDTMNVVNSSVGVFDYTYNAKTIGTSITSSFTIADVGPASYSWPAGYVWRWTTTDPAVNLSDVQAGDMLYAFGTLTGWNQNNKSSPAGNGLISGFPIVGVNASLNYVDVLNPFGAAMGATVIGAGGTVQICPTPSIQWKLTHAGYISAASLSATSNVVTVLTNGSHFLSTGDSITIRDSFYVADGTYGPITVTGPSSFTFALVVSNFVETLTYASIINSALTPTLYRLQSLGFNGLVRISASQGQSPNFLSCGVAVDDYISISGSTFSSNCNGLFRVLAVDNNSVIVLNSNATDQLNTVEMMNNQGIEASFITGTNTITGVAGTFKYVSVGDWVKKQSDPDSYYLQVESLNNVNPALATSITIGGGYAGTTGVAVGVVYDQTNGYDKGVYLQNINDIQVYEGDSVQIGDTLFVQNIVNTSWFNALNVGSFSIVEWGTEPNTYLPFIRVNNASGINQSNVNMSINADGLYVIESTANKFYTIREVKYTVLDDVNSTLRNIYISPYSRSQKLNVANNSTITHLGKIGYSNITEIGIDGYIYYTGLLQKVQRIVDGFEPDIADYPGQRGLGTSVETLPPLPYQVNLSLNIVTNAGVNLGDVSNNIKSVIINYIEGLGVGDSIIMSQIIADVQAVTGVASVVFTVPAPSTASITLNSNEKAIITANSISIA
ncbi:unnamed protein product [Sphagnum balticum]